MKKQTALVIRKTKEIEGHVAQLRKALAEAKTLPDCMKIAEHADAIRRLARKAGVLAPSVNACMRVKIDAQREGDRRIQIMRELGELAEQGRPKKTPKSGGFLPTIQDLIGRRSATQRASQWHCQGLVPDAQLNRIFEVANSREQTVAEMLITKLGAAVLTAGKRSKSRTATPLPDGMELRIGDCRIVLADVPDNSVPLILTDPPYGDEAEPLYEWLAEWSARVLIPGGSLICYTGQSRLDRDMRILSSKLRWWWLLAMMHHQSQRFPGKFVIANFKPVMWFVKDFRRSRSLVPDILTPPKRDKELHNWGQGDGGISPLVEHLTEPTELIVDPFAGSANWGRICTQMGRRWLGADIVQGGAEVAHVAAE